MRGRTNTSSSWTWRVAQTQTDTQQASLALPYSPAHMNAPGALKLTSRLPALQASWLVATPLRYTPPDSVEDPAQRCEQLMRITCDLGAIQPDWPYTELMTGVESAPSDRTPGPLASRSPPIATRTPERPLRSPQQSPLAAASCGKLLTEDRSSFSRRPRGGGVRPLGLPRKHGAYDGAVWPPCALRRRSGGQSRGQERRRAGYRRPRRRRGGGGGSGGAGAAGNAHTWLCCQSGTASQTRPASQHSVTCPSTTRLSPLALPQEESLGAAPALGPGGSATREGHGFLTSRVQATEWKIELERVRTALGVRRPPPRPHCPPALAAVLSLPLCSALLIRQASCHGN